MATSNQPSSPNRPHRTVLITGANGGIGCAIARAFLDGDPTSKVWLGVRSNRDAAVALAAEPDYSERCHVVTLDVGSSESWEVALNEIAAAGDPVNVLVNNAGSHSDALLATMSDEAWSGVLRANLDGTFYGCRAVTKGMIGGRWGRIINVSSLSAILCPAGQANYSAAKAGVVAMGSAMAKEVARLGITVNAVCPGYIETAALDDMPDEQRKAALRQLPMRRFGTPDEVAGTVFFLAGDSAAYITGVALRIDGGMG